MAMISCEECSAQISDKGTACVKCGAPISLIARDNSIWIRFPVWPGQLVNTRCDLLVDKKVVARCRQGETLRYELDQPREIQVVVHGSFGKPSIMASPGDRLEVGYRGFGKIFLAKVDQIV
jgi:hypothetical protein